MNDIEDPKFVKAVLEDSKGFRHEITVSYPPPNIFEFAYSPDLRPAVIIEGQDPTVIEIHRIYFRLNRFTDGVARYIEHVHV